MVTRRCVDSAWVRRRHSAAAAATPTPYHCRLYHQLLRPLQFLSCPRPVFSCSPNSHILFSSSSSVTTTAALSTVQQSVIPLTTTPTVITHRIRGQWSVVSTLPYGTRTLRPSSSSGRGSCPPTAGSPTKQCRKQQQTYLIRSYHTLAPLFRHPPIPRRTRRAHSTRSPSVS